MSYCLQVQQFKVPLEIPAPRGLKVSLRWVPQEHRAPLDHLDPEVCGRLLRAPRCTIIVATIMWVRLWHIWYSPSRPVGPPQHPLTISYIYVCTSFLLYMSSIHLLPSLLSPVTSLPPLLPLDHKAPQGTTNNSM